ncbi:MAG: phage terminase large subunit, partial [Planctomycetia bacterium]|nr:phage terminase large subunit [Planctomycetia bacterium]
ANDPTVGLRMVQCLDGYYITDLFRDKILFPVQKKEIENNFNARRTRWVLVEDKASGQDLIPALRRDTRLPIKAVPVDKDKVSRVNFVAPVVESQRVFLKAGAPWIQDFIDECAAFPKGQNDDQVDAFSQALTFFLRREKGPSVRVHHYDDDEDSD